MSISPQARCHHLTEVDCFVDGLLHEGVAAHIHHLGGDVKGCNDAVLRGGGRMHHERFVEESMIKRMFAVLDVDHRCLEKSGEQFMGGLGG